VSFSNLAGERGLRASLPCASLLTVALLLVACGGPDGSLPPSGPAAASPRGEAFTPMPGTDASSGRDPDVAGSGDLDRLGGRDLEVAGYPVEDALAAEGGEAAEAMLASLGVDPADVGLTLAVAPGGDPTVSDWGLPGASAGAILDAWDAAAPGTWSSTTLGGLPALSGSGPDGSSAWALAVDGRFVYVRTDDPTIAEEVAVTVRP